MQPIICIYKIVSPSGAVYIGQTWDFNKRYRSGVSPQQRVLYRSYKKYGEQAHEKTILQEFDSSVTQGELDNAEIDWIQQYRACGRKMLNIRDGGSKGKPSPESIKKATEGRLKWMANNPLLVAISSAKSAEKRRGQKRTDETRRKQSDAAKGRILTAEHCAAISAAKKGKPSPKRGIPMKPEQIEKMRIAAMGNKNMLGKHHSDETKALLSTMASRSGSKNGRSKLSEDDVKFIRATYTGAYGQCAKMSREFGIHQSTMRKIIDGVLWSTVT